VKTLLNQLPLESNKTYSEKEGNLRPRAKEFYLLLKKEADRTLLLSPLGQNK